MNHAIIILLYAALPIGIIHTLTGPDHYIPFIALSKARQWSLKKTAIITTLCGISHVVSATILGLLGVALSHSLTKISWIANFRNSIATWLLIVFGLAYFIWGLKTAFQKNSHGHTHCLNAHHKKSWKELTPWLLFLLFVLGPCQQLIPLIIYPAMKGLLLDVFLIALLFGIATVVTMLSIVLASVFGTQLIRVPFLEKYGNATAGAIILSTGIIIKCFGL